MWQRGEKVWGVRAKWQTELRELCLTRVWRKVLTQNDFHILITNVINLRFDMFFCMLSYYIISLEGEKIFF